MRKRVFFGFVHLGVRLTFVLEDGIPTCSGQSGHFYYAGRGRCRKLTYRSWWDLEQVLSFPVKDLARSMVGER